MANRVFGVAWAINAVLYAFDWLLCKQQKQPVDHLDKLTFGSGLLSIYYFGKAYRGRDKEANAGRAGAAPEAG